MSRPVAAIVGRPNVGKSMLFNAIAGERISIVQDTPGVTRDRIYADCSWTDRDFTLIDTGGIEPESKELIPSLMREQAQAAIDLADVVILLLDAKDGLTDADSDVAGILRRSAKPILPVVNKIDNFKNRQADVLEFYALGLGDPIPVSAANKLGIGDMLDSLCALFPKGKGGGGKEDVPRIAIVGRPNVGKSSLVNKFANEERVIVSEIAGTTRDAIDTTITRNGREYIIVDTAGLRRKSKIREQIERYSILRAIMAVEKADVVILVIDAKEGVSEQDAKIAGIAHDKGKGLLVLVNKWDLIEKDNKTVKEYTERIRAVLSFTGYAEILFVSALTGLRLGRIMDVVDKILESQSYRVPTGVLNEIMIEAAVHNQPPNDKGRQLKMFYATQVAVKPPTFVIFVNYKDLMHFSYIRYLENQFRGAFGFGGTPLRFIIRERKGG